MFDTTFLNRTAQSTLDCTGFTLERKNMQIEAKHSERKIALGIFDNSI